MLKYNVYIQCVCVYFSKAFDTVNHQLLVNKLASLSLKPSTVALTYHLISALGQIVSVETFHCLSPLHTVLCKGLRCMFYTSGRNSALDLFS